MDFGLSQEIDEDIVPISSVFTKFSQKLEVAFKNKSYGDGVHTFTIGIICTAPIVDYFFTVRKKYSKKKRTLEYDIKLDHATAIKASPDELRQMLAQEILGSLSIFSELKIKEFNTEAFREDLKQFFAGLRIET